MSSDERPRETPLAVEAYGLGKSFRIDRRPAQRLRRAVAKRLLGERAIAPERLFWALRDVSLRIAAGETVGIMGVNGSGKSTLLEILAGTLQPSAGGYRMTAPVAALLDLGSGFNPEFTGRENVALQAAVHGYGPREVAARLEEIAAFADIGAFLDRPVKTYSNGMLLRLAFAVATAVEPAVLLVDEVLAVGDEAFQRRCFARMEAMRRAGATVLFTSHDATSVLGLCNRVVLLDRGELLLEGDPKSIVETYHRLSFAAADEREALRRRVVETGRGLGPTRSRRAASPTESVVGEGFDSGLAKPSTTSYTPRGAVIEDPAVWTMSGERVNVLEQGGTYVYSYTVRFTEAHTRVRFGMLIKTKAGYELGGSATSAPERASVEARGIVRVDFRFRCHLLPGVYFLNAGVMAELDGEQTYLHRLLDAAAFRVVAGGCSGATGIVDFDVSPRVSLLADES